MATSLQEALALEATLPVEHIWLDKTQQTEELTPAIGFRTDDEYVSYSEELINKK